MRIGCVCRVLVNVHWQQMPACLLNPLTPFKQIIIFRDIPLGEWQVLMICAVRKSFTSQRWQIGHHPDVQLQLHQKPICNGKIYDLHLAWGKLQPSLNRRSSARHRRSCFGRTADDVRACARNHFRLLTNCRLWFYWCMTLKLMLDPFVLWASIDYEPMCFQYRPEPSVLAALRVFWSGYSGSAISERDRDRLSKSLL